ncbi:hypothetical protein BDD12DRAFT_734545 [Trichophaea hybrida]|nr:hypothetical protein BDD12DRAFT_734545 [Trichophaea hybrida]
MPICTPPPALVAKGHLECALRGRSLLNSSFFNKGSAFTHEERKEFELQGMLPSAVHTLDEQVERAYGQYLECPTDLLKNTFMVSLKEQNVVLFYALSQKHITEIFSIIYTPTEAEAIKGYSRLFRRPDGCFLDINEPELVEEILAEWGNQDEIDYIVVSDGEEILGIGDQGVGGIAISTTKASLVLMTLCGGLHPNRTLPVILDCGTNNKELLDDELYLGLRHPRIRGKKYDDFVETFVQSVKKLFPKSVLHFEDFGLDNARRILEKYRPQLSCFNDDIQGTGVVTLAAINAAAWISKLDLLDLRMLVFGAGSAGCGIADQFRDAVVTDGHRSVEEANKQVWLIDKCGLLLQSHGDSLTSAQRPYARPDSEWEDSDTKDLVSIISVIKPHILIGTSTKPKAFTEAAVREMAKHIDRPIILPLSNPTRLHEAEPADIYAWTDGKALVATGSPFPPVKWNDVEYEVAENNNSEVFPAIGLGAVLCRAKLISDKMLVAAVKALAAQSPVLKDSCKGLLPGITDVRDVGKKIAMEVIRCAVEEGLATVEGIPVNNDEFQKWVEIQMWDPAYRPLKGIRFDGASRAAKGEVGVGRR